MSITARIFGAALLWQMMLVAPSWGVEVGEPIPDFGMRSLAGENISRASLAGKPLLLVFWNTWCPLCKKELPQINRLAEKYHSKGLSVVAINTGLNDSESKARAYWKKNGYQFPVVFDQTFDIGGSFRVMGVPTVLLVDAKGIVRYKGTQVPENMEELIRQVTSR